MTAPTVPERTTKRADQLVPGDILARNVVRDRPVEVLGVHPHTDFRGDAVTIVFREEAGSPACIQEFDADHSIRVESAPEPTGYRVLARDLRKVAYLFDQAGHVEMREHQYIRLNIQPRGANDEQTIERTDALGLVLFGRPGQPEAMGDGSYHYDVEGRFGCVEVHLYSGISTETARAHEAAALAAANEAEIAKLRARIAELEGLTYSRADDDPQVVRPHSPRPPLHVGAVGDGGELVDETPRPGTTCEQLSDDDLTEPPALTASGLTQAADLSRGVLAGTTPVVTYFSFGHGQTDPDSGQSLLDHYVTVVAPTYEKCREAMFASRFGRAWSFDYLAGRTRTTDAVSRWTEHEVIIAPGTDRALAAEALMAANRVLFTEPVSESR